jgi:hypothetical protein
MEFNEETSELFESSLGHEEYKQLIEELKKSCLEFTKVLFPTENVNLDFPNLRDITSVYCEGKKIKVNNQLLFLINSHLTQKYLNDSSMFKDINEELIRKSFNSISELAIEFIILHEISHMYLDHLKIKKDKKKYEYYKESIEFDADRLAANLLFGKFLIKIKKSDIKDYKPLIEKFIYFLFDVIHIIYQENKNNYSDLDILKRMTIISIAFGETKNKDKKQEITDITISEIEEIIIDSIKNFMLVININFKITESEKLDLKTFVKSYLEKSTL